MSSWLPRLQFLRTRSTTTGSSNLYTALPTLSHNEGDFDRGNIIAMEVMELKTTPGQGTSSNALGLEDMHIDDPEGIEPTEEEKRMLRRVSDTIPVAAFSIVIVELCERFAFYGLSGPFQNYLQNPLPEGGNGAGAPRTPGSPEPAGALGLGQTAATSLNNMFSFLCYIFPIFGAILADARWGRYKAITFSCYVYFIGLLVTTAAATPRSLAIGTGFSGWLLGIVLVAAGTGGIKCNVSPLVADQYRRTRLRVEQRANGERVIVDPKVTITRIYNIFYWCINVGSLSSVLTTTLERSVGFWAAFLLPTCVFVVTPLTMVACSHLYYRVPPSGSILVESYHVCRIAARGLLRNPVRYSNEAKRIGVWERAKPSFIQRSTPGRILPSKITWDDDFVDEVKRTARACEIFLFYPLYWIAFNQLTTNLVSMGATLTTNGIPNDLLTNFDGLALIIFIPLLDGVLYPALRRSRSKFISRIARPIFRIWMGFTFGALAMAYSAILQYRIYRTNPCGEFVSSCPEKSSISVWAQVPAYIFIALSEIFALITALEYAYNKAPEQRKSLVMAVFFLMTALGSVLNVALAPLAVDPMLVWNYAGISLVTFTAGNVFYWCFRNRDERELEEEDGQGKQLDAREELEDSDDDSLD